MKNERSRFEKRTQSFLKTNAVVSEKEGAGSATAGRRGRNERAAQWKRLGGAGGGAAVF